MSKCYVSIFNSSFPGSTISFSSTCSQTSLKNSILIVSVSSLHILAPWGCCNTVPHTWQFKTTEIHVPVVLKARCPKSRCQCSCAPSECSREECFLFFLEPGGCQESLVFFGLYVRCFNLHFCLHMVFSSLMSLCVQIFLCIRTGAMDQGLPNLVWLILTSLHLQRLFPNKVIFTNSRWT